MNFRYPSARRCSSVDNYFGHKVPDPFRWIEDPASEETKEFIVSQNNLTFPYFKTCPDRDRIGKRLTDLWNYPKYECPIKVGNFYYIKMNSGLQNQSVLYKMRDLNDDPEVFIDPNEFSSDGLIALVNYKFSEDGMMMAYATSESGSDWNKIKVRSVKTKEDLPDLIIDVKFSSIAWTHDNKGFFYCKCPNEENDDGTKTTEHKDSKLFYHVVGTDQSEDILCVEFPDKPTWMPIALVSHCGQYLFLSVRETCKNEKIFYCDLQSLSSGISGLLPLTTLVNEFAAEYNYVTNEGSIVIFHTDKNAPFYRIVGVNLEEPHEDNWVDIISEDRKKVLERAVCVNGDKLLVCYIEDVKSVLSLHDLKTGHHLHTFSLDVGHVRTIFGKKKEHEVFFYYTSFLTPGVIYYCNLNKSLDHEVFKVIVIDFDTSQYKTEQVFYLSKDGTKIPMFIVYKKNFVKDASAPALLYGYGGFNYSILPFFSIFRLLFVQHFNGILGFPNIRGGGEYGEKWHLAGSKFKKQNCFDDYIAAAEFLIKKKYTSAKKLIINGGSNGGLLVGACINQRPELFGCAIAEVGVFDMLRYHKFTIGHAWKCDFCCADDSEEEFKCLLKFSPYHNVKVPNDDNIQYPAVLLVTGDHDDRVVPLHSLKFIAELQSKLGNSHKQANPLLIRVDTKVGHGFGKPTFKVVEELTDICSFICNTFGIRYED